MHLKTLTLKGFKSFASATTLQLEPGITCVVGPNGSGKSNVVDALAWVMGEQGAKTLRGGKMEDVIFAGTSGRPPLGRAEVSLTIDNSDGALPIDYGEVTITRTMFRSGGSEYQINGTTARLLDLQDLLADSGIGREMHVIVGQNQLDAVLRATPEERRGFIEEAAGVLKHRKRKEKALRKLDAMQANLTRLTDLTGEIRRQLGPLGRQAEVARRAQAVQAEVRDLSLVKHKKMVGGLPVVMTRAKATARCHCEPTAPAATREPYRAVLNRLFTAEAVGPVGDAARHHRHVVGGRGLPRMGSSHTAQPEDLDMPDATFACPDLTTFARLDELGLGRRTAGRTGPRGLGLPCRRARPVVPALRLRGRGPRHRGPTARARAAGVAAHHARGHGPPLSVRGLRARVARHGTSKAAELRAKLSRRPAVGVGGIVCQHVTVARVAQGLAVAWNTANDAVPAEGKRVLIDEVGRFDDVRREYPLPSDG